MAACSSKPIMKPLSMANSFLLSSPSIFTSSKTLSFPSKPTNTKPHLSLSFSLHKKSNFSSFVAFVAAQEDKTVVLEQEFTESEGEEAVPEAVGDAAGEDEEEDDDEEESGGFSDPPEDAKIFIGNLPYDIDSEKLAQLFEQAGVVEIAEVIYNRETDQSRGFGFVTMSTVEEADKAVQMLNRYDIGGRSLTVNKAAPRGSKPERTPREYGPSYRIYAGNLPWDFDDAQLEQVFSEYGKVVNARVVYDRDSGRSRGFAFVTMSSETEMNDAVQNLDGQSYGGRSIRVSVAEEKPRRNF